MNQRVKFEEVLILAEQLPPLEKLRLVTRLLPRIERDLQASQPRSTRLTRGVWRGLNITEDEIAEARREMWGGFPREI